MYCRGCGYDLRKLDTNRCPECGRAFDTTDQKTYHLTYRRYSLRRIVRSHLWKIAMAVLVLYSASYLLLVEAVPTITIYFSMSSQSPPLTGYVLPLSMGPPEPMTADYRWGGEVVDPLFVPANWIDRHIRPDMWLMYPAPIGGVKVWELASKLKNHPQYDQWEKLAESLPKCNR